MVTLFFTFSSWATEPQGPISPVPPPEASWKETSAPHLSRAPHSPSLPSRPDLTNGCTAVFSDTFEAAFPGDWEVKNYGTDTWGKRDCRAQEGTYSAWCGGWNPAGESLACGTAFSATMPAVMEYGPFNLEDAWAAEVSFWYWLDADHDIGSGHLFGSLDRSHWCAGSSFSPCPDGWCQKTVNLADIPGFDDPLGQPEVWIKFGYVGTGAGLYEGLFVDNVTGRKWVGTGPSTPTPSPTCYPKESITPHATCTPTSTSEPPVHTPTPTSRPPTSTPTFTPGPSPTPSPTFVVTDWAYLTLVRK